MYNKLGYVFLLYTMTYPQGVRSEILKHIGQNNKDNRIMGGSDAAIKTYPYMAKLEMTNESGTFHCGGAIISNYSIVTAAHCLEKMQRAKVRISSSYSNTGGYVYLTTSLYQHPRFNRGTLDYDIGVVNIDEGMYLDRENSSAIGIASITNDPPEGESMFLTGWGKTGPDDEPSEVLQMGKARVVNRTYCDSRIRGITRRMFCIGGDNVKSCQGDSGSPAVGKSVVVNGITSFGVGCGVKGYPTVYTRIGHPLIRTFIGTMTGV